MPQGYHTPPQKTSGEFDAKAVSACPRSAFGVQWRVAGSPPAFAMLTLSSPTTLSALLDDAAPEGLRLPDALRGASVPRVCADARSIGPGDLFLAVPGVKFDGKAFAAKALAAGAAAALGEGGPPEGVPADRWFRVDSARRAASARFASRRS